MPRRLFTVPSILTLLLCAATGVAFLATMKAGLYGPDGPGLYFETVPWLAWASAAFAVVTFGLLLRQARRITTAETRSRSGLCPRCGYDLRATPGRCPECGRVPATASAMESDVSPSPADPRTDADAAR